MAPVAAAAAVLDLRDIRGMVGLAPALDGVETVGFRTSPVAPTAAALEGLRGTMVSSLLPFCSDNLE